MIGESRSHPNPDPAPADVGTSLPATTPQRPTAAETGGRNGPDPTRFGDWEKGGRCIDF